MKELKPYQLVRVQEEGFAYIGEVISRPIGDDTIQVRRVPGDATTMENMPLSKLKPWTGGGMRWVHYAKVSGRSFFPVDMMRYDFAAPVNFTIEITDSEMIAHLNEGETEYIIANVCETKSRPRWTPARWNSFGWNLTPLHSIKLNNK